MQLELVSGDGYDFPVLLVAHAMIGAGPAKLHSLVIACVFMNFDRPTGRRFGL
jgi:hypothetical protein